MNDELPPPSSRSPLRDRASSIVFFVAICLALGLGAGLVMLLRPDTGGFGPSAAAATTPDAGSPAF
jgi:hypothetical protein